MLRKLSGLAFAATLFLFASNCQASNDKSLVESEARLGIGVSPLPEVLTSHLPDVIGKGRGVLVSEVMEGSAAAAAGLKKHDVLVRYDDQDLYSPEQLVKRVRNDDPGKVIELQFVRSGKLNTISVTLGEEQKQDPVYEDWDWSSFTSKFNFPWSPLRPEFWTEAQDSEGEGTEWTQFQSLSVIKQDDGGYRVGIVYKDSNGKSIHNEYTGTRQEIRDAISSDDSLPKHRKDQLLRTLDDRGRQPFANHRMPDFSRWNRQLFDWPNVQF